MALTNQEVVFTFNAETGEVEKVTTRLVKDMEKVADAADDAAKATEEIGKNAKSAGTGLKKAGTLGAQGFKALGTAIKATGIGLLVGIVVKLTQKMTENKKIAEALEVVFNGLGVVFNVLVEALTPLGDLLISAFTQPQEAVQTLRDNLIALKDYFGTLLDTAINPVYRGLLNLKRGFYEAAIASKEFIGLDASELKQTVREIDEQLADLVVQQEENKDALSAPWQEAAEAIKGYVEEAKGAVTQSTALTKQQQALRDAQRELNVATAEAAAEVEELKRQSDDQRLSVEERIEAATRAAEINQRFADQNVALSQQQADLIRQEIALQGESQERLEALAQAEIEAAAARQASATIQTELQNKIFGLNQEVIAQEQTIADLRREFVNENLEGIEAERQAVRNQFADRVAAIALLKVSEEERTKLQVEAAKSRDAQLLAIEEADRQAKLEILQGFVDEANALLEAQEEPTREGELEDIRQNYAEQIALAQSLGQETLALTEAQRLAELEINKKYDDLELEARRQRQQATLDVAKSTLDALAALNEAFTGESEQEQKKGFERSKKIQTAQALISTYESAVQAFKSLAGIPVVGPGLGTAAAVAATAAGLANVKKIQSQTFQGGGGGGGSSYSGTGGPGPSIAETAAQTPPAPTLDLGFLGEGAQQQVIETYVISENVTSAQQANKKIQDQSTL
jgi:hypothetical protein